MPNAKMASPGMRERAYAWATAIGLQDVSPPLERQLLPLAAKLAWACARYAAVCYNTRKTSEERSAHMANELDEMTGPVNGAGRDINVIEKQLPVRVGWGSTLFEIVLWCLFIVPGLIFLFMKIGAKNYFQKLQQKIQADASTIDNYLEQRVQILKNLAKLVEKAIDLDKDVMKAVAAFRGGRLADGERNAVANQIDGCFGRLFPQVEAYPDLKAHAAIADAIQQNSYLQKEITAARQLYNDSVMQWNADLFDWPTKQIVAARAGYTTRIPFTASAEVKSQARGTFF